MTKPKPVHEYDCGYVYGSQPGRITCHEALDGMGWEVQWHPFGGTAPIVLIVKPTLMEAKEYGWGELDRRMRRNV